MPPPKDQVGAGEGGTVRQDGGQHVTVATIALYRRTLPLPSREEPLDPPAGVRRRSGDGVHLRPPPDRVLEGEVVLPVKQALEQLERGPGERGQLRGITPRLLQEGLVRVDPIHQSEALRLARREPPPLRQ